MKKALALASIALLATSLTACGGGGDGDSGGGAGATTTSSSADYCALLESAKDEFTSSDLSAMTQDTLDALPGRIDDIEAAAPDDVKQAWATTGDMLEGFRTILSDAGISLDDLDAIRAGEVPEGVDLTKLQELPQKLTELTSGDDLKQAQQAIQDSAKSECDIDMGAGSSPSGAAPSS